jgi:hypothetical protein
MANFSWWPNHDALLWFLRNVWPAIETDTELHLFGRGVGRISRRSNVVVHGPVDDVRTAYRCCHLAIAPILRGAGVKIKLAEALYNRVPALTTTSGARGLAEFGGIQVLDTPQEWIQFLNGPAARAFASTPVPRASHDQFNADAVRPALTQFLQHAMHGSSR